MVTAALVAAAVGPLGAATATAQAVTVVDDTAADFSLGTPSNTLVRTLTTPDGAVELSRTLEEQFTVAPAGWTSTTWAAPETMPPPSTVLNGTLVIDGQRADSGVTAGPGSSLVFTATFGTAPYNHVGFATDFDQQPWAMFSTGGLGGGQVYARTSDGAGPALDMEFAIPGVLATDPHTYRIDWTATGVDYYVDGGLVPVVSHAIALTAPMRPQASDFAAGGGAVSVDSMILNTHKTPGTFISRPLDSGDARVTGLSFTPTADAPAGTTIGYETRTAATSAELAAAPWAPLGAGNTVTSPAKQFLQYRATMATTVATATPRLNKIEVGFTLDTQGPVVTIDDATVSGGTVKVTFHSDDANAVNKCKLDNAAFANCTSPAEFSGLADGTHTIVVQATDAGGNPGTASKTIEVDTHAPTVTISDVAVSGTTANVTFSSDDPSGVIKCRLDSAAFAGCASPATFSGLAAGSHTVIVQSTDGHGNVGDATRTFVVAGTTPPPSGGGTTPPPAGTPQDLTAPKVRIIQRSVRVSKRGIARIRVTCPQTEVRCMVTVKLKLNGTTVARKTLTVRGGTTRAPDLQLSKAARATLAARSKVKVSAVVTATDAAGNQKTTQIRMTLRAPSH